jgi:hypothetical protein
MSGATFPYIIGSDTYLSSVATKIGSRWFISFGIGGDILSTGPLFYSDNANAVSGWTATTGLSLASGMESLHGEVIFDGTKHYAAKLNYTAGTTTVYASSDGGATWAAEYTTATATGFEVNTAGTTAAWIWRFHVTGTTGSDHVRVYAVNGVCFEKLVGTSIWSAKASNLVNPLSAVVYGGAMAATDYGPKYSANISHVRYETAGVFADASGF